MNTECPGCCECVSLLKQQLKMAREALRRCKKFIEYARYELQDGKAIIGDQFPRKVDADEHIAIAEEALKASQETK